MSEPNLAELVAKARKALCRLDHPRSCAWHSHPPECGCGFTAMLELFVELDRPDPAPVARPETVAPATTEIGFCFYCGDACERDAYCHPECSLAQSAKPAPVAGPGMEGTPAELDALERVKLSRAELKEIHENSEPPPGAFDAKPVAAPHDLAGLAAEYKRLVAMRAAGDLTTSSYGKTNLGTYYVRNFVGVPLDWFEKLPQLAAALEWAAGRVKELERGMRLAESHLEEERQNPTTHPIAHCPVLDEVRRILAN